VGEDDEGGDLHEPEPACTRPCPPLAIANTTAARGGSAVANVHDEPKSKKRGLASKSLVASLEVQKSATPTVDAMPPGPHFAEADRKALEGRITEWCERARTGDAEALSFVEQCLINVPSFLGRFATLEDRVEQSALNSLTSLDDTISRMMIRKQLARMRVELLGDNATALERLLVGRIIATWLQVQVADLAAARDSGCVPASQAAWLASKHGLASKRHLGAVKALAQVRRMKLPAVQINVGAQQVNVAGAASE
jgi:hypothetical protein